MAIIMQTPEIIIYYYTNFFFDSIKSGNFDFIAEEIKKHYDCKINKHVDNISTDDHNITLTINYDDEGELHSLSPDDSAICISDCGKTFVNCRVNLNHGKIFRDYPYFVAFDPSQNIAKASFIVDEKHYRTNVENDGQITVFDSADIKQETSLFYKEDNTFVAEFPYYVSMFKFSD